MISSLMLMILLRESKPQIKAGGASVYHV